MLKEVGVSVFNTIESVVGGEDVAGIAVFDLEAGGVGYSTSGDFMDQETIDQLEELKASIVDGTIEVPTAP